MGIGGLLSDAYKVLQLIIKDSFTETGLLNDLLESSLAGLNAYMGSHFLNLPVDYRLAFRELAMSIGLHSVERIKELVVKRPDVFLGNHSLYSRIDHFGRYTRLRETIEKFWLEPRNRKSQSWTANRDINSVVLATSLAPDGYLEL